LTPWTLRFEDLAGVARLDLQSTGGWRTKQGFKLGDEVLEITSLSQAPFGEIDVAQTPKVVEMFVPLTVAPGMTWAQIRDLHTALVTELTRATNILRFIPPGAADVYLIDTYRSPVPSLFSTEGQAPSSGGAVHLDVVIRRAPELRGAAAYV
jgi:hypothetical protein